MTPTLTPPSVRKTVEIAKRGIDSLSKRPAPPAAEGAFEWAYFRAVWTDAIANLSGTSRSVDWGPLDFGAGPFTPGWEIFGNTAGAGTDVFTPRDTGGGSVSSTDRVRWIDVELPGWITVSWSLDFDLTGDAANGDVYSMFTEWGDGAWGRIDQHTHAAPSGVEATGGLCATTSRWVPFIDPFDSGSQSINLRTLVSWSGPTSGEDVQDGWIDITWIGGSTETGEI